VAGIPGGCSDRCAWERSGQVPVSVALLGLDHSCGDAATSSLLRVVDEVS